MKIRAPSLYSDLFHGLRADELDFEQVCFHSFVITALENIRHMLGLPNDDTTVRVFPTLWPPAQGIRITNRPRLMARR